MIEPRRSKNELLWMQFSEQIPSAASSHGGLVTGALSIAADVVGIPALGAIVGAAADYRNASLRDAVVTLSNIVARIPDDILRRLRDDPVWQSTSVRILERLDKEERREKIEYYGRLLVGIAEGLTNTRMVDRHIDTLDALKCRHLMLFHALASDVDAEAWAGRWPPDPWQRLAASLTVERQAVLDDFKDLESHELVQREGWGHGGSLRFALTDYGLAFEETLKDDRPRQMDRWAAEVTGESMEHIVPWFSRPGADPRLVRLPGGAYLTTPAWDTISSAEVARAAAQALLDDFRVHYSLTVAERFPMKLGVVLERTDQGITRHPLDESRDPRDTDPYVRRPGPFLALQLADHPTEQRLAQLLAGEPGFPEMVEAMNLIERDVGGSVAGYPDISEQDIRRFDAQSNGLGLERPMPGGSGAMQEQQARAVCRRAFEAWLNITSGHWPSPAERLAMTNQDRKAARD